QYNTLSLHDALPISVKEIPTKQGKHDLENMLQAIDKNTKVVWLCTPDNPTGAIIPESSFIRFMEQCPSHVAVVLDEAYVEFMDEDRKSTRLNSSHVS